MKNHNFNWNATAYFEELSAKNKLAQAEGFTFSRVSGLEGFEEALHPMQRQVQPLWWIAERCSVRVEGA